MEQRSRWPEKLRRKRFRKRVCSPCPMHFFTDHQNAGRQSATRLVRASMEFRCLCLRHQTFDGNGHSIARCSPNARKRAQLSAVDFGRRQNPHESGGTCCIRPMRRSVVFGCSTCSTLSYPGSPFTDHPLYALNYTRGRHGPVIHEKRTRTGHP